VKAAKSGVSVDNFDVDSEMCAVLGDGVLAAGVAPALGDGWIRLLGLIEKTYSCGILGEARAAVTVSARISPIVSVRMPRFRPTIFLTTSVPWLVRGTLVEVFTLWGVDDGHYGFRLASFLHTGEPGQVVVELGEDSLIAPGSVVGIDGAVVREAVWEVCPGDSRVVDVEECVEYVAQVDLGRLPGGSAVEPGFSPGRQRRLDQGPSGVGKVAGVRLPLAHAPDRFCVISTSDAIRGSKPSETGEQVRKSGSDEPH
jgi:hypothetical protein